MNSASPFQPGDQVVAYLRDSGGQDQDLSVEQQESVIRAWCIDHRLILTVIFRDLRAPGSNVVGRRQFREMVHHFQAKPPETGVILWKYSRFARDIDDAQFYKALLRRSGYIIHSLQDAVPNGIDGRFFEAAIDWMNNKFLEELSADVRRGIRHLVEQYGCLPGTPPVGFRRVPVVIGKRRTGADHIAHRWEPDPAMTDRIRLAWQMRARRASYREINQVTNLFRSVSCYPTFFTNRLYIGELHHGELIIPDYCPPVIDPATWETVQMISKTNLKHHPAGDPNHPRRIRSNFLLSGILFCGECGAPMNGHTIQTRKNGQTIWQYYICSSRQRRHDCNAPRIPRQIIEQIVTSAFDEILDPDLIAARQKEIDALPSENDELQLIEQETRRQLGEVRRKIKNLVRLIADQGESARSLLGELTNLECQETEIETRHHQLIEKLDQVNRPIDLRQMQIDAAALRQAIQTAPDMETLRAIIKSQIDRITARRIGDTVQAMITYLHPPLNAEPPGEAGGSYAYGQVPPRRHLQKHKFTLTLSAKIPRKTNVIN